MTRFNNYQLNNISGRSLSDTMSTAMQFIINLVLENAEECRFS